MHNGADVSGHNLRTGVVFRLGSGGGMAGKTGTCDDEDARGIRQRKGAFDHKI
jgi:hypothetical protein